MKDLQTVLNQNTKQDPSRHHVWNIDKLFKQEKCVKGEKRDNTCKKREEKKTYIVRF